MIFAVRRLLASHPRLVLAALLAFGMEIAPPLAAVVSHRHAGGGSAHSHAGRIVDGTAVRDVRPGRDGFAAAPASDLHEHGVHPFVAVAGPVALAPSPALFVSPVLSSPALAAPVTASRPASARAPPASVA